MLGCERAGSHWIDLGSWWVGGGVDGEGSAELVEEQGRVVRSSALASVHLRHLRDT